VFVPSPPIERLPFTANKIFPPYAPCSPHVCRFYNANKRPSCAKFTSLSVFIESTWGFLRFQMALHTVQDVLLAFSFGKSTFRTPLEVHHEQLESTRQSKVFLLFQAFRSNVCRSLANKFFPLLTRLVVIHTFIASTTRISVPRARPLFTFTILSVFIEQLGVLALTIGSSYSTRCPPNFLFREIDLSDLSRSPP